MIRRAVVEYLFKSTPIYLFTSIVPQAEELLEAIPSVGSDVTLAAALRDFCREDLLPYLIDLGKDLIGTRGRAQGAGEDLKEGESSENDVDDTLDKEREDVFLLKLSAKNERPPGWLPPDTQLDQRCTWFGEDCEAPNGASWWLDVSAREEQDYEEDFQVRMCGY